ncbi:hypothetical protein ABT324_06495 [Saccharopolyspora sp. NPDC000359]|uniref:hypothetical protein n=1 Tax=Saccharopolyspora sp. NPDC000359 TaxID=3154251 RepID=UPI00332C8B18
MPATTTGQFSAAVDEAQRLLHRLEGLSGEVLSAVRSKVQGLPGAIADEVLELLAAAMKPFADGVDLVREYLAHPGDADALTRASDRWNAEIGGVVTVLSANMSTQRLGADDLWDGRAAYAYKQTIPGQQKALESIKTTTDAVKDALVELSSAITSFLVSITTAVASLAAAAGTIIVASLATLPGLVAWFLSCATATVAFLISAGDQLSNFAKTVRAQMSALEKQLASNAGFPNNQWPRQTTDLSNPGNW